MREEKSKKEKIGLVRELMQKLEVTPQEMISALNAEMMITHPKPKLIKGDNVCVGMFWYYDNTFSFGLIPNKAIKAVVEHIDDEFIYGDLTASPNIQEFMGPYCKSEVNNASFGIEEYIKGIPYTCDDNEEIVCYSYLQMEQVQASYERVKHSLKMIGKMPRKNDDSFYWTTDKKHYFQRLFSFKKGYDGSKWMSNNGKAFYRPVLRMKYN